MIYALSLGIEASYNVASHAWTIVRTVNNTRGCAACTRATLLCAELVQKWSKPWNGMLPLPSSHTCYSYTTPKLCTVSFQQKLQFTTTPSWSSSTKVPAAVSKWKDCMPKFAKARHGHNRTTLSGISVHWGIKNERLLRIFISSTRFWSRNQCIMCLASRQIFHMFVLSV